MWNLLQTKLASLCSLGLISLFYLFQGKGDGLMIQEELYFAIMIQF